MYIGEFHYRRTHRELVASTGKTKTRPGRKADQVVLNVPHLRIVSDEVFNMVQARLEEGRLKANQPANRVVPGAAEEQVDEKPRIGDRRRATYVFSGKMTCGMCGAQIVVLSKRLGCDGRANQGNDCPNNVRIPREEVEAAVFQAVRDHLLQPELLDPYLAEYAKAQVALSAARNEEADRLKAQLAEAEKSISNLMAVAARSQNASRGAERLAAEVDRMEAARERYEQELAAAIRKRPAAPTQAADVIAGVERLLDQLGPALEGDAPEAIQARELMRELIDTIIITPLLTPTKQRRGSETVQIVITGQMDDLFEISQTTLGRVTLSGSGTKTCQALASRPFRLEVLLGRQAPKLKQTAEDSLLIERLLAEAQVPLTNVALVEALLDGAHPDPEARRAVERRVRNVMHHLRQADRVRAVRLGTPVGWVLNDHSLSDDEWRDRVVPASLASTAFLPAFAQATTALH
jgi:hypothetical protein